MENKMFVSRIKPSTPWGAPWTPGCPPRTPKPWDPPFGMPPCTPDPWTPFSPLNPCVPAPMTGFLNNPQLLIEHHPLYRRIEEALTAAKRPRAATGPKRTQIFFVLDESLSMGEHKEVTIRGYNDQVQIVREQHLEAGETTMSLVLFNSRVKTHYVFAPVNRLEKLTSTSYNPKTGRHFMMASVRPWSF